MNMSITMPISSKSKSAIDRPNRAHLRRKSAVVNGLVDGGVSFLA